MDASAAITPSGLKFLLTRSSDSRIMLTPLPPALSPEGERGIQTHFLNQLLPLCPNVVLRSESYPSEMVKTSPAPAIPSPQVFPLPPTPTWGRIFDSPIIPGAGPQKTRKELRLWKAG